MHTKAHSLARSAYAAIVLCHLVLGLAFGMSSRAKAQSSSEDLTVSRFTLLSAQSARIETGHLLNNGHFQVISSQDSIIQFWEYPFIQSVSGRVVMLLTEFELARRLGWVNHWVRSDQEYWYLTIPFVIVCIKGLCDPNTPALPNLLPVPFGWAEPVTIDLPPRDAVYDDEDVSVYWAIQNNGALDIVRGFRTALYLDDAFVKEFSTDRLARGGTPPVMIHNLGKIAAGNHAVKIVVDWKNDIGESDENDNTYTKSFVVVERPRPPTIISQPTRQTVTVGSEVTFTVVATGTGPLRYQWQKNGTAIPGATSAALTLNNVQSSDAGSYTVVVSNSAGSVTSAAATLTVNPPLVAPTITTQPQSQAVAIGETVVFTVIATGTAPLSYQWRLNGAPISGATSSTLTVNRVGVTDGGVYTVVVSNVAGSTASQAATLTVNRPVVPPTAAWTIPPPPSVKAGDTFQVAWITTGDPTHVNIHWHPSDPLGLTAEETVPGTTSGSTASPTASPALLTAPAKHANGNPIVFTSAVKYVVHVRNEAGEAFSPVAEVIITTPFLPDDFAVDLGGIGGMAASTPPVLPPPPELPAYELGKDSVVFITHGRTPAATDEHVWVDEMKNAIKNRVGANWQVMGYKWIEQARVSPINVLRSARWVGEHVGTQIVERGLQAPGRRWKNIHLIAHSAGAELIEKASERIRSADGESVIHTTFLDAFVGWPVGGGRSRYGSHSDWSDSYFASDVETWDPFVGSTEGMLEHAHNVEVTGLDPSARKVVVVCSSPPSSPQSTPPTLLPCGCEYSSSHSWPYEFYLQTITNRNWAAARGYGFALSQEAQGWARAMELAINNSPVTLELEAGCAASSAGVLPLQWSQLSDLSVLPYATSETGIVLLGEGAFTAQAELPSPSSPRPEAIGGEMPSPVAAEVLDSASWLSIGVTNRSPVNVVRFQAQFTSSAGARGVLRVFWNNEEIGSVDENYVPATSQEYAYALAGTELAKLNVLGFRLEAFSAIPSVVTVSDIATGFVGYAEKPALTVSGFEAERSLKVRLTVPANRRFLLEAATDLVNWEPLAVIAPSGAVVGLGDVVEFVDQGSAILQRRFYRLKTVALESSH